MPGRVPRVTKTEAIVLGHRRLGDADRIVTLLTPHRGKVDVVAKGLLRSRSKMAGHLEPLTRVEVVLAHGRSMDIVTQAQAVESFPALRRDLDRLSTAMYLLELVDRLTVEHADARPVYELLHAALLRTERGDGVQLVTRTFELSLLDVSGFRPEWTVCVACGAPVDADDAGWSALAGGVLCPNCRGRHPEASPLAPRVLRVLRAYQSQSYEDAARIRLDAELMGRLERVMHDLVRSVAERDLKSAAFVSAARRASVSESAAESAAEAAPVAVSEE
ncbi:MAG: DNA repair protein RecO [Dehalococcoidia bacterium]|nr:DNA repair protein RecO [Dehalococcoidia bacterium]